MKKNVLILLVIISPFLAIAQFKVDLSLGTGVDRIYVDKNERAYWMKSGFSYNGGVDAIYMFNSKIGIGSGLFYSYYYSSLGSREFRRSSNAISIPLNILYHFKSIPIEVLFGTIANFNLNRQLGLSPNNFEEYKPLYMNLDIGGFYYLSKKFKLGIIADVGLTPYFEVTYLLPPQGENPIKEQYFLRSLSLKLNYTLFGK